MYSIMRKARRVRLWPRVGLGCAVVMYGFVLLIALAGCGGDEGEDEALAPSTSPTSPTAVIQSVAMGTYRGTTSQNLPIEIQVGANNIIDRLVIRIRMDLTTATCTVDFTPSETNIAITNGQFQATVRPANSQGITSTINGSFQETTISGTYEGSPGGEISLVCGTQFIVGRVGTLFRSGTFTAAL
jgi:hypothetical protein